MNFYILFRGIISIFMDPWLKSMSKYGQSLICSYYKRLWITVTLLGHAQVEAQITVSRTKLYPMRSVSYAANISCLRTKITALAQGCSSGLFDEIPSDYKCIDRDIPMRGRGGCFTLKAKYCFCWGDVCTEYNEIWMKHNPNPISIPNPRPNEMQPIASDYSLNQHNYAYHGTFTICEVKLNKISRTSFSRDLCVRSRRD